MKLLEGPFERIKQGTKTLEIRLFDEKRKLIKLDDIIVFSKLPNLDETVSVRVVGLLIYKTFADMIEDTPTACLGYKENEKEYLKGSMYEIYSKKDEQNYGVLGIRVELM